MCDRCETKPERWFHYWASELLEQADLGVAAQVSIGQYRVDFIVPDAKLVVELDGTFHNRIDVKAADRVREEDLEARGFGVFRLDTREATWRMYAGAERLLSILADRLGPKRFRVYCPPLATVDRPWEFVLPPLSELKEEWED